MIEYPTHRFKDRHSWRRWLEARHATSPGIWIKYYKKASGKPGLRYQEALEEALCFGWIDSLTRRIDDETYVQKFTPRSPKSEWSERNLRLIEELRTRGLMAPAGEEAVAKWGDRPGNPVGRADGAATGNEEIPGFLMASLKKHPPALENFLKLAPGYKRLCLRWVLDAKREDTRLRRADEVAGGLRVNKKLGMK